MLKKQIHRKSNRLLTKGRRKRRVKLTKKRERRACARFFADLHPRIAQSLGWTEEQTRSFSLAALRDLVRPISSKLVHEIDVVLRSGEGITRANTI